MSAKFPDYIPVEKIPFVKEETRNLALNLNSILGNIEFGYSRLNFGELAGGPKCHIRIGTLQKSFGGSGTIADEAFQNMLVEIGRECADKNSPLVVYTKEGRCEFIVGMDDGNLTFRPTEPWVPKITHTLSPTGASGIRGNLIFNEIPPKALTAT